jgi:hypothetical protein
MADFIVDVYQPFLTDAKAAGGLAWIAQNPNGGTPPGGAGVHPNYQRLYSRGSIGTEAPPFLFVQTTAKTLFMYTGNDVNTAQEPYDQPGNPMNEPPNATFSDPSGNLGLMRTLGMTTMVGPYDNYWLFGGPTGEYCHCVIKVSARQYRHFHIGMLTPLHTDLHADTFYMTNHRWDALEPDNQSIRTNAKVNKEHAPYEDHILPFRNHNDINTGFTGGNNGDARSAGMIVYSPLYGTENYDWWLMCGVENSPDVSDGGVHGRIRNSAGNFNTASAITKSVGDVNNGADAVLFGAGWVTGYDKALGTTLFASDPTFTTDGVALVPIYVMLCSDFSSDLRWAPVGQVPDVFRVNMKNLDAEQEITVGSDTYTVFPMMNKDSANTLDNEGYSGYEGLAYKKITANAT